MNTSVIIDDLEKRAASGDEMARALVAEWEYPVEMMFVKPDGSLISKLNSFKDFPGVHPDVSAPPHKGSQPAPTDERAHAHSFLKNLAEHFGNP